MKLGMVHHATDPAAVMLAMSGRGRLQIWRACSAGTPKMHSRSASKCGPRQVFSSKHAGSNEGDVVRDEHERVVTRVPLTVIG